MAYLFNPPKRCSAEWETEDSLCEVATGHAAEGQGLLRARSRGQAAAETDCRERRCKLLFRSQRETAWAKVRQKMRKETSYSSLVASFLKAGFREDKVRVASSPKKGDLPQAPELQPATILGASDEESQHRRCTGLRQEEAFTTHPCLVDAEGAAAASSSSRWQAFRWGGWVDVDPVMQKALVQADNDGPKVAFSNGGVPYIADLARMVLLNEKTGRKRLLRFEPGDQEANQAPKPHTLAETGTTSWLGGSRCQVFVEGSGWKAMSINNSAIQTSLQGQRIFDTEAHGCRYRVNLEAFECTNLTLGRTSPMRPLQDAFTSPPAVQLSSYFSLLAGSEKAELLAEEAATSQWLAVALTTTTETEEGRDLILAGAGQLFSSLAVARPGRVTREEWMHFWLMRESSPSHYALAILQGRLAKLARRCPEAQVVGTVLNLFLDADSDTDGEISQAKMSQCCSKFSQKSWEALGLPGAAGWLRSAPKRAEAATLNYFEFVSELVGRQRHDVWLYQYNIPAGLAAEVEPAQAALLQSLGGFWHTSIVVFGREYWYGRQCFEGKLQLRHFGEPAKRTYLGATQCSQAELWDKMDRELCREYTGDSYDVIQHSSRHFAQEVVWFLLNKHLPDEAWLQPPSFANAITDIRPLLNQWFGRLSPEAGADEARGSDVAAVEGAWSQLAVGSLVSYARDGLPSVIAEVISKEAGACDLWWWEPRGSQHGRFVEAVGVSKMQVTNLGRHTGRWRGRRATDKATIPNRQGPAACLAKAS